MRTMISSDVRSGLDVLVDSSPIPILQIYDNARNRIANLSQSDHRKKLMEKKFDLGILFAYSQSISESKTNRLIRFTQKLSEVINHYDRESKSYQTHDDFSSSQSRMASLFNDMNDDILGWITYTEPVGANSVSLSDFDFGISDEEVELCNSQN